MTPKTIDRMIPCYEDDLRNKFKTKTPYGETEFICIIFNKPCWTLLLLGGVPKPLRSNYSQKSKSTSYKPDLNLWPPLVLFLRILSAGSSPDYHPEYQRYATKHKALPHARFADHTPKGFAT